MAGMKTVVIHVAMLRTWGAAVLRPYKNQQAA